MNKIKSLLKNFWFWLRSKTTLDEKAIDVYEEISDRAKEMKKELKDVKKALKNAANQTKDVLDAAKEADAVLFQVFGPGERRAQITREKLHLAIRQKATFVQKLRG